MVHDKRSMLKNFLVLSLLTLFFGCNKVEREVSTLLNENNNQEKPKLVSVPTKNPLRVKVAMFLPMSGQYSKIGKGIVDASQLALYELRADNIDLRIIDVGSTKESAKLSTDDIDLSDIDVALGPVLDEQYDAIYNNVTKKGVVTLSYLDNTRLKYKDNFYLLGIIPEQQVQEISNYAASQGFSNIYAIVKNSEYGSSVEKTLLDNQKRFFYNTKDVVFYQRVTLENSKLNKDLKKKNSLLDANKKVIERINHDFSNILPGFGHPAVLLADNNKNAITVLRNLRSLSKGEDRSYKVLGIGDWSKYRSQGFALASDVWISDIPHDLLYAFDSRFYDTYKYLPSRLSAIAYDSLMLISAISYPVDGTIMMQFQELERANGYQGVTGVFRLKSNGLNERLMSVYKYRGKKIIEIRKSRSSF